MSSTWTALLTLVISPVLAEASTQIFSCRMAENPNPDRIKITLRDSQSGTFLYETPDSAGTGSTEPIRMKRVSDPAPGIAAFEVQSVAVQMTFKVPQSRLFQAGSGIEAQLVSRIPEMDLSQEQTLLCDSTL